MPSHPVTPLVVALCLGLALLPRETHAATSFRSCENKADPIELRVTGCPEPPCKAYLGGSASMEVDFEVGRDIETFKVSVVATAFGAKIPYPVSPSNGCLSLTNAECPLDRWEQVTYRLTFPVDATFPQLTLPIEVSLLDDATGSALACFSITVAIVAADSAS